MTTPNKIVAFKSKLNGSIIRIEEIDLPKTEILGCQKCADFFAKLNYELLKILKKVESGVLESNKIYYEIRDNSVVSNDNNVMDYCERQYTCPYCGTYIDFDDWYSGAFCKIGKYSKK